MTGENFKTCSTEIPHIALIEVPVAIALKNELYLGHRTVTRLYNNFIIEISFLAIKNGLVSI